MKPKEIRYEDEKRRQAFKEAALLSNPIPCVIVFTSVMKLKAAQTAFGKRKAMV